MAFGLKLKSFLDLADTPESFAGMIGKYLQVGSKKIEFAEVNDTNYVGATFVVAASDSKDTKRADYVCDGTDDQSQIQSAINALPSSGGRVLLLEGNYNISATISIMKSNVTLAGQGNGTKLFLTNSANRDVIDVGNGSTALEGVVVRDLQIDGNKGNQNQQEEAIYFRGGDGYLITKSAIKNCKIKNSKACGIELDYSNNNIIIGNQLNSNIYGLELAYSNNNIIIGNQLNSNSWDTMHVYISNNNIIIGNQLNSDDDGLDFDNSNNNIIIGNQANSNSEDGFYLQVSSYNIIVGNRCQGNSHYGINIYDSDCHNNYIGKNYLTGNTTAAYNDAGTGTVFGVPDTTNNIDNVT